MHVQHVRPNRGPTKRGHHKRTGIFLQHSNMPEIMKKIIRKRFCVHGGVTRGRRQVTHTSEMNKATAMTKKVVSFSGKNK